MKLRRANVARIGLVGSNGAQGLGYQNRDIARQLEVDRWLVTGRGRASRFVSRQRKSAFLRSLDWVLFTQHPVIGLTEAACRRGVRVACVPNWEFTSPELEWMSQVHLMICPTLHCYRHLCDWKRRYGFQWHAIHVPWPVDTAKFKFRPRHRCRRFLFINGGGGGRARRLDGTRTDYRRKGGGLISQAAEMAPELPFRIFSQSRPFRSVARNVAFQGAPKDNRRLYVEGDVCVQPSHWEGIGLQLLECQAAGIPLVTTDAPPMNEYNPLVTIPVIGREVVCLTDQPFVSPHMSAQNIVEVLRSIHGSDILEASHEARAFIERVHSWKTAKHVIRSAMQS